MPIRFAEAPFAVRTSNQLINVYEREDSLRTMG